MAAVVAATALPRPDRRARTGDDRGSGVLSTTFGIAVFLGFLLFSVQLLLNLYATSTVTAITYDAARAAARHGRPPTASEVATAEANARAQLGPAASSARFEWDLSDPEHLALRVTLATPRLLPLGLDRAVGLDVVERSVEVRIEQPQ